MKTYWVYILASNSRRIYVGVTNNVVMRVGQHRAAKSGFTWKYNMHHLVYCESTESVVAAIAREKQLKGWSRSKKVALIESVNPRWVDLLPDG